MNQELPPAAQLTLVVLAVLVLTLIVVVEWQAYRKRGPSAARTGGVMRTEQVRVTGVADLQPNALRPPRQVATFRLDDGETFQLVLPPGTEITALAGELTWRDHQLLSFTPALAAGAADAFQGVQWSVDGVLGDESEAQDDYRSERS